MQGTSFCVITFPTTSHVLRAERLFQAKGITVQVIPVPRYISSDCAICIKISSTLREEAMKLLQAHNIAFENIHELEQPRHSSPNTFFKRLFGTR